MALSSTLAGHRFFTPEKADRHRSGLQFFDISKKWGGGQACPNALAMRFA